MLRLGNFETRFKKSADTCKQGGFSRTSELEKSNTQFFALGMSPWEPDYQVKRVLATNRDQTELDATFTHHRLFGTPRTTFGLSALKFIRILENMPSRLTQTDPD